MRESMPNRLRICTCGPSKRLRLLSRPKTTRPTTTFAVSRSTPRRLGEELNLGDDDLEALRAAAVLHDIGKLAVPEYIISKPGKLSPEEFEKMKIHPVVGAEILEHVQFPYPVVPIVRAHHEKWNGTGYPFGLRGKDIPIGARILSAVDALDALASDRQYRRALPLKQGDGENRAGFGQSVRPGGRRDPEEAPRGTGEESPGCQRRYASNCPSI